ncbi:unnamed protein product [Rangifer tarandus platyrhynchus]|uniref:Uncharacterized protein n=2 Tax=Rangifer tarandus platyrhynchus TaxID=3082113 RepID=A0AC60A6Z0_RANTA|nr:unnamed protein product [Rangifer tarandus platyrhynchus]
MYRCWERHLESGLMAPPAAASSEIPPFLQSRSSQISPSHPSVPLLPRACARRLARLQAAWLKGLLPKAGGCTAASILSPPSLPSGPSLPRKSLHIPGTVFCPEVDPRSSPWGVTSGSRRAGATDGQGSPRVQGPGWDWQ